MRNLSIFFHVCICLCLFGLGFLFFSLPFSHTLSSLLFSHLPFFSLLGLGLMVFGIFFLLSLSSHPSSLTLRVSSYEVSLNLIRESLRRFCEKNYPQKKMELDVFLRRKHRLEIQIRMQTKLSLDEADPFLQQLKKQLKDFLCDQFDYHRTFFLTIVTSK
jgi:hypothetical protein